jgi:hypothetical protein
MFLSFPIILLFQASLVMLGAIISAKADTLKGANQAFGIVVMAVVFGGAYGIPLAVRYTALRGPAIAFATSWLTMPFPLQYLIVLAALALLAGLLTLIARALFRRDKLLG